LLERGYGGYWKVKIWGEDEIAGVWGVCKRPQCDKNAGRGMAGSLQEERDPTMQDGHYDQDAMKRR